MNSFTTYPQYEQGFSGNTSFFLDNPYAFKYKTDAGLSRLECEAGILKKPSELYSEDWTFDIYLSRVLSVESADELFGPNGIACKNAKVGLCIMWASSTSYQRGVFDVGEVKNTSEEQVFNFSGHIEKSRISGLVKFIVALYIKEEGTPEQSELHLANTQGTIIGVLDENLIYLDNVEPFPIVHCGLSKDSPLWDVRCNWTETSDNFNETVTILFNSDHTLYKYLDKNDSAFDVNLVREILASALIQIILKYKETDENFDHLDSVIEDSVADYVRLYIKEWGVDPTSLNTLSRQLRRKLEQKISTIL